MNDHFQHGDEVANEVSVARDQMVIKISERAV
jgi:hypothetical protein